MNEEINESNSVFILKTVQIQPIKCIFSALKEIMTDINIKITKEKITIAHVGQNHQTYVNAVLNEKSFQKYYCEFDLINVIIPSQFFFKIISTMSNSDTLTLFIKKEDYENNFGNVCVKNFGFRYENGGTGEIFETTVRSVDEESNEMHNDNAFENGVLDYNTKISTPSGDFQSIVKRLASFEIKRIRIESQQESVQFKGIGSTTCKDPTFTRIENEKSFKFDKKPTLKSTINIGEYDVKTLLQFIKCTPLCESMEIFIQTDKPIIMKYKIGSLGHIYLLCANKENVSSCEEDE